MKLSILDQSPIPEGKTAADALKDSLELAQAGEKYGYSRFWVTEHHDMPGLACSAPEILLSYIGALTHKIRIGSGALLLPHYKPYKVAEQFNMLASLFPGRIDLGIGRAPGGSAEATSALSDTFLQQVYKMPELVDELLHFLHADFSEENIFSKITPAPVPQTLPVPWVLGTSAKSAKMAAEKGMAYAFGQFMSDKEGAEILSIYNDNFTASKSLKAPMSLLTINAVCAETAEKAREIAESSLLWNINASIGTGGKVPSKEQANKYFKKHGTKSSSGQMSSNFIIGNPAEVKDQLIALQQKYKTDELMILTIAHDIRDRINSYELIAREIL
ncbi:luciferase family oxidoreductase, group 1 [Bacillus sp. OV322]|uniref:LLM class flavin-dependent oxidoreductase n=1 Tax=Bacillus sp. OV322 TaxID=1882764 RepID=UPI0008E3024C|nr:LLM class flavin-dependent oxidoreductase [Bacillus sp. OV322]SFC69498.1 luciferase family oxidoreductase, group 1 [Bacillus sp. OV322]